MDFLTGSCLCGRVTLRVPDDFEYMGNCHCSECRKFSGSDYAAVGGIDSAKFELTNGADNVSYYRKSAETDVAFCSTCGSSLFSRKRTARKHNIRLGILDDAPSARPAFHIHTASRSSWSTICDDLPQFEHAPPQ